MRTSPFLSGVVDGSKSTTAMLTRRHGDGDISGKARLEAAVLLPGRHTCWRSDCIPAAATAGFPGRPNHVIISV